MCVCAINLRHAAIFQGTLVSVKLRVRVTGCPDTFRFGVVWGSRPRKSKARKKKGGKKRRKRENVKNVRRCPL